MVPRCCFLPLVTRTDSSRWVTITLAYAPGTPAFPIGTLDSGWLAARPAGAILLTRTATGSEEYHLWMIETAYGQDGPEIVPGMVYVTKLNQVRQYALRP